MVLSNNFVYESANPNPRKKELFSLDSTQRGLSKNVENTFLGIQEADKLWKHKYTLLSETPCIFDKKKVGL